MRRRCETCRYWQKVKAGESETCNNVDSDMRFDETDANYSCSHWEQTLEQDGNATWYTD